MKYQYRKGTQRTRSDTKNVKNQSLAVAGVFMLTLAAASLSFGWNRAAATVPGTNVVADISASGSMTTGDSYQNVISRDGRFVAFTNNQGGFTSGSSYNGDYGVYIRDLINNTTTKASMSTAGVNADHSSAYPVISETGRYVAYASTATNLIDGRTISSSYLQMYLRDTVSGTTSILSEVSAGTFANNTTYPTDVSSDGRFVLFRSLATNLGPTMSNGSHNNVFLLDRSTSAVTWINAQASGAPGYGNDTVDAQMNCDGSLIVFDSGAAYLGLPNTSHVDVFLLDRRGGGTLTDLTGASNGAAMSGRISCNGNYVGFMSYANNLDPATSGLALGYYHPYIYDRINSQFKIVDQSSAGTISNVGVLNAYTTPIQLSLSDKGAAVFYNAANNLVSGVSGGHVYIRDSVAGATELLSRDSGGTAGDNASSVPTISLDGKKAAYISSATNLVSGDTNGLRDIFVSDTGL